MKRITAAIACLLFLTAGVSFAHEHEMHGRHKSAADMKNMHEVMHRYAKAKAAIDAALDKGDTATVVRETTYISSTSTVLNKAKPHKRVKELKEFRVMAKEFEKEVKLTGDSAQRGDLSAAKASFANVQRQCDTCHAKFRD